MIDPEAPPCHRKLMKLSQTVFLLVLANLLVADFLCGRIRKILLCYIYVVLKSAFERSFCTMYVNSLGVDSSGASAITLMYSRQRSADVIRFSISALCRIPH
jgi:hypothetical protein